MGVGRVVSKGAEERDGKRGEGTARRMRAFEFDKDERLSVFQFLLLSGWPVTLEQNNILTPAQEEHTRASTKTPRAHDPSKNKAKINKKP